MADTILPGYQTNLGNKNFIVIDHAGPASYPTGGEVITAAQFGLGGIDAIIGSMDQSNTYFVEAVMVPTGGANSTMKLFWFTLNGTQVTNATDLSAKIVRLTIIGV